MSGGTVNADRAAHTVIDSPIGPLTLVSVDGVLSGIYMVEHRHQPDPATFGERDTADFDEAITQLTEYFDGRRTEFTVRSPRRHPVPATRVGRLPHPVRRDPDVRSAGRLALGDPDRDARWGGQRQKSAQHRRAVPPGGRRNGSLTGYAGGLDRKRFLLDREAERAGRRLSPMTLKPFEDVVAEHGPTVLRVCRAVLGPVDAEDAWSETFLVGAAGLPGPAARQRTSRRGW